ncbi:MAG: hypothetical protein EBS38_04605 [Actinobacteria bacterium]|nr:hypothetical protein [Actinomycetota bacterium]
MITIKNRFLRFLNALNDSWSQLAGVNLLDWRIFLWFPAIHFMSGASYEEVRLGVPFLTLLPSLLFAEVVFFVSFFGGHWLLSKLDKDLFGSTGKLIVIVGGSQLLRGLALEYSLFELSGLSQAIDVRRLPGDFTLGVLVAMLLAYLTTAQQRFALDTAQIEKAREQLAIRRSQAEKAAEQADGALRQRAQQALLGKLNEVQKYLAKTNAADSAEELRRLVEQEVRPLSKDIWDRFEVLAQESSADREPEKISLWPKTVPLKRAYRPGLVFLFANLNIIATANALAGPEFALTLLLYTTSMLPIGAVIRGLIPASFEPKFVLGFFFSCLLIGVSLIPTWIYLFSVANVYEGAVGLRQTGAGLIILVILGLAIRASYVTSQEQSLRNLEQLNSELEREIALIEQAVWIAKRNWSFIIHGTVQGALTVAHSRLKQTAGLDKELLKLVTGDIDKARKALQSGLVSRQSSSLEFGELIETWDGVCSIEINCDFTLLDSIDETSRICTIEIVKEIVGNAFRHGKATKIEFKIEFENGVVLIVAKNNGSAVTEKTKGLGTDLLNELTAAWSISNVRGGVEVRASIPFRTHAAS